MYLINLFYDQVQLFKVYQREDGQKLHNYVKFCDDLYNMFMYFLF